MRADLRGIAERVALAAALASTGYAAFALRRLALFERGARDRAEAPAPDGARPTVTVLKPAHGDEPELEENLASFCAQEYPYYEVVLGVLDPADPALAAIARVARRFPGRVTVVVGDGVARHRNPKIATLDPMIAHARGEVLVIADSDMRVTPRYLDAVLAPFEDPSVGAVTCVFRGEPAGGDLASALGAMAITEQFMPSTLVANAIEPMTYCFGSTMAVRRRVFDAIGGLAALGEQLADDHTLGSLVVSNGDRIALASYVVANVVDERDAGALIAHELRWNRTIRSVRPASYPGILFTYPLPLALTYLALARNKRNALVVTGIAAVLRVAVHRKAHAALGSQRVPSAGLIPLRDVLGVALWCLGLFGGSVRWRGAAIDVAADGRITSPTG